MRIFLPLIILLGLSSYLRADEFHSFNKTCNEIYLQNTSIGATCLAKSGKMYFSMLRLRGITNRKGILTLEKDTRIRSTFFETCVHLQIIDGELRGRCKNDIGSWNETSLDLKNIIFNYNGSLVVRSADQDVFDSFVKMCKLQIIDGSKLALYGTCMADNGGIYKTQLLLRRIINQDGVLTVVEKDDEITPDLRKSCTNLSIDSDGLLIGQCLNKKNRYVLTTLDLKPFISSYNGTLVYSLHSESLNTVTN